jgi:hypothetical protein
MSTETFYERLVQLLVYLYFLSAHLYFHSSQFVSDGISGWVGPVAGASELAKLACFYWDNIAVPYNNTVTFMGDF